MYHDYHKGNFIISTDPARLNLDSIHSFLARSYWANHRSREVMEHSIKNSLCFGLYAGEQQIGFARVVTDYATFAWLCDVFIEDNFRGEGLGKWLIETVVNYPELQGLRRFLLATRDAQGLYRQYGFTELTNPDRWMEIHNSTQ